MKNKSVNLNNGGRWSGAKECAFLAVFVALTIAAQLALSFVPGIELVTALMVAYCFTMGCRRGMAAAACFTLLRQLVFGIFPTVLILYFVYYNLIAVIFGLLGRKLKMPKFIFAVALVACACTVLFTMLDNVITPLWFGYGAKAAKMYFYASLTFMLPQVVCTAVSVGILFYPLHKVFLRVKKLT